MPFKPTGLYISGQDFATSLALASGNPPVYPGTINNAIDPALGLGEFIYLQAGATITAQQVCEFSQTLTGGVVTPQAIPWAGAAGAAKNLCVSLVAMAANEWGWFQIQGNAVVQISGTVAAGDKAFWQATGVVSTTQVAGKQALGMVAVTANAATVTGYTMTNRAVYAMQRPISQGQIL